MTVSFALLIAAWVVAALLAAPTLLFALEVTLACVVRKRVSRPMVAAPPQTAILIPAHNEAAGIAGMLAALFPTLRNKERVIVIADNCTDRTAEIARDYGAEVIERNDETLRGKGYALEFGVEHLSRRPPKVLVILDADCSVSADTVARLATEAELTGRPVQGLYLCYAPEESGPPTAISALAFQFKNQIRPLGLATLGGPSYLTGSGIAIPWSLAESASWGGDHLVEDMQLGIDFALAGHSPEFLDDAEILSPLPAAADASHRQRTRWEHGHLKTLFSQCPRLFATAVSRRRPELVLLGLDLAVPPLALLAALWTFAFALTIAAGALTGNWYPAAAVLCEGNLLFASVLAGWFVFCRANVPWQTLLAIPGYIVGKLSIYGGFFTRRERSWVRTKRAGEA